MGAVGPGWARSVAPWIIDLPITPDQDGLWTNKFLDDHVVPVGEATWIAGDGLRYLRPEIVLFYKARLNRPKDHRDRDVTWPLLGETERAWLVSAIESLDPAHPWLTELEST